MLDLAFYQYALIAIIFVWSGFVRSGLGFGGAVFSLPFLLMIVDQPLLWLPLIAIHLLVFSSITVFQSHRQQHRSQLQGESQGTIDWGYLRYALAIMIVPKLIGVFGLITLPPKLLTGIIFFILLVYSISYIANRSFSSNNKTVEVILLMLGGYVSGTTLIGAPLIMAVFAKNISRHQLRDSLFVLWFILVAIKLAAFIYAEIDLQLIHHLWLLPCVTVGHLIGLRLHQRLLATEPVIFYRGLGIILLALSLFGLWRSFH